jgi:phosphoribosylaminoimidazolecarboxamide formyltransferase/IMP cyclohydrolase
MAANKRIKSALLSVFHKDGLEPLARLLHQHGVQLYSTGGTQDFIEALGLPVTPVENLTEYPSILGGRVKTLHPKIFGGILGRRNLDGDLSQMEQYAIPEIDLVVVDLYPFEETVASGAIEADIIEKIDIGGISLIRAAAKNYADVLIVPTREAYAETLDILTAQDATTTLDQRKAFAKLAFDVSSHYDTAIHGYFAGGESLDMKYSLRTKRELRYGENPHQRGAFFGRLDDIIAQLHGKELSYNNLLDVDAAVNLLAEFYEPTVAVIKHNNACGLASRPTLTEAFKDALAGDPVSAFGGIVAANQKIDAATAAEINTIFCEVVVAPGYDDEALAILKSKKNRVILTLTNYAPQDKVVRTVLNGFLVQDRDVKTEGADDLRTVTAIAPSTSEIEDLLFAAKICKHTKSNTIVLARQKQLIASGTGQTSRVDALRQAIAKAEAFNFSLDGAVMASDAFFPFADSIEIAHQAGIEAVIQPGGSIRDQETIDYCNAHGVRMVFTGIRHFKH